MVRPCLTRIQVRTPALVIDHLNLVFSPPRRKLAIPALEDTCRRIINRWDAGQERASSHAHRNRLLRFLEQSAITGWAIIKKISGEVAEWPKATVC